METMYTEETETCFNCENTYEECECCGECMEMFEDCECERCEYCEELDCDCYFFED